MNKVAEFLLGLWERYIKTPILTFAWTDVLDILFLTVLFYFVYTFVKARRAGKLVVGVMLVLLLYAVSDILALQAMHQILSSIVSFGVIILVIIFHPEIRDVLEKLGSMPNNLRGAGADDRASVTNTVNAVVDAACQIAMSEKDGALIVIERSTKLGEYVDKGLSLDAEVSSSLLRNIFVDRSPLHDGAVIIRNNRISSAGCKLPLATNEDVARGLGTRHRAAIGITEVSDCVVVVVSEEKHMISIANAGLLKRDYNRNAAELRDEEKGKTIQKALREDLFLLVTGRSAEDSDTSTKRASRRMGKRSRRVDPGEIPADTADKT